MPIFQDDIQRGPATPEPPSPFDFASPRPALSRKGSEESISTDLCDGPLPDLPPAHDAAERPVTDRGELIERLKRGESPAWWPSRRLDAVIIDRPPSRKSNSDLTSSPLLPAAEISEPRPHSRESETLRAGLEIERPRSALHSGDFNHEDQKQREAERQPPWLSTSPPRGFTFDHHSPPVPVPVPDHRRSRAPSLSSSFSSLLLRPPTSPLAQSLNNDDLDIAQPLNIRDAANRHLLSSSLQASPPHKPFLVRHSSSPYQAHQPRRSLTSNAIPQTSPTTPALLRSRRLSYASESSPLHHASMVGSYEESILRGRMSTNPSKPLDFVAQIGVLGKGKCKSSLRCPAHVTIPFPAVFYSYNSTSHGRSIVQDGPSPYVGQIDLENGLPPYKEKNEPRNRRRVVNLRPSDEDAHDPHDARRTQKQSRRSSSPKAPLGGSYRIPEKGQLQIIIKNPNKTAVKLFLIPYDLAGMEPGTKTFLRQRIYSAGPIIDMQAASAHSPANERPILRYLIHVHICCPSRGRFYLYKSIRVVFANRVPDGKEHLINEIQLPEPRFSVYKPARELLGAISQGSVAAANLTADKAVRRRSSGFNFGPARAFDAIDSDRFPFDASEHTFPRQTASPTVDAIPFALYRPDRDIGAYSATRDIQRARLNALPAAWPSAWPSASPSIDTWDKLSKGDLGYGGNAYGLHHHTQGATESLLARRLRGLNTTPAPSADARDAPRSP